MRVDHDQGVSPSRGMNRLGREHDNKRQHHREQVNPSRVPKGLETENTHERATEVAAKQRAWLGRGCTSKSE